MLTGAVDLLRSRQTFKDVHKWVKKVPNKSMRISGIWRNKCVTKTGKHFWCAFLLAENHTENLLQHARGRDGHTILQLFALEGSPS